MNKRLLNGVLLLDKQSGISSNAALQRIKYLFQAKKAGHTGSLDPLASGMLPICFGEATKFSHYLLDADKTYQVKAQLGIKTTTGDCEGEILQEKNIPHLNLQDISNICQKFVGNIEQIPPMYSALKYQGRPLYQLARSGITVERKKRCIRIFSIHNINLSHDQLSFEVKCSKGTYIRTLIEDIGDMIGCGAHVIFLHRKGVAKFSEEQLIASHIIETHFLQKNYELMDDLLLPVDCMLTEFPQILLDDNQSRAIQCGQMISVTHEFEQGLVRLYHQDNIFLGMGEFLENSCLTPKRLLVLDSACHKVK